jgi:hypothetical protein
LCSLNKIYAQSDTLIIRGNHKVIFSISGGIAIPVGKFSTFEIDSLTYTDNIVGVAGSGYSGKFQVMYLINKRIGVSCMFYSSIDKGQPVDSAYLFYDPAPGTHGLGGGKYVNSYNYSTKNWFTYAVLPGIVMIITDGTNPVLYSRVNLGVQKVECPESRLNVLGAIWSGYPSFLLTHTIQTPYNHLWLVSTPFLILDWIYKSV